MLTRSDSVKLTDSGPSLTPTKATVFRDVFDTVIGGNGQVTCGKILVEFSSFTVSPF
jgi:hypothetical protein